MYISEIYPCLQGEARLTGVPSVLVRTSLCNLRCMFAGGNLCDTPFTSWNPETNNNMTVDAIVADVDKAAGEHIKHIIISGGEPTIQKEFPELLSKLSQKYHVTTETNGTTVVPVRKDYNMKNILFSISPKLSSSVPHGTAFEKSHNDKRLNFFSLKDFYTTYDTYFKFVMCAEDDLTEIREVQKMLGAANDEIYLMPEGIIKEDIEAKSVMVSELCQQTGYRMSTRLHILLYGNVRKT